MLWQESKRCVRRELCRNCVPPPKAIKELHRCNSLIFISDSDRIQTCNLLIRSQVLYSVKLRNPFAGANIWQKNRYTKFFRNFFSPPPPTPPPTPPPHTSAHTPPAPTPPPHTSSHTPRAHLSAHTSFVHFLCPHSAHTLPTLRPHLRHTPPPHTSARTPRPHFSPHTSAPHLCHTPLHTSPRTQPAPPAIHPALFHLAVFGHKRILLIF